MYFRRQLGDIPLSHSCDLSFLGVCRVTDLTLWTLPDFYVGFTPILKQQGLFQQPAIAQYVSQHPPTCLFCYL